MMTCYLIFASKYPGGTAGRGEWAGDGTRQAESRLPPKLGDRHREGSLFSHISLSLLLYEFEFSTIKLFVKNKGKTKIFPSNKRKITKKQEGKTIAQMEAGGGLASQRSSLGGAARRWGSPTPALPSHTPFI